MRILRGRAYDGDSGYELGAEMVSDNNGGVARVMIKKSSSEPQF
jgi:hypothetical protein